MHSLIFFHLKKEKPTWLTQSKYFYFVWEGYKLPNRTEGTAEKIGSEKAEIRKVPELQVWEAEVSHVGITVGVTPFQLVLSASAAPLSTSVWRGTSFGPLWLAMQFDKGRSP